MQTCTKVLALILIVGGVWAALSLFPSFRDDSATLPNTYVNRAQGFSIRYPAGYAEDDTYIYQALGPGRDISGVKFTIPPTLAAGTNLATDSYLSVEHIAQVSACTASLFFADPVAVSSVREGEIVYSVASTTGAGAGNRYEETVYALLGTNPCRAVRYFIHSSVIENYPAGAVRPFNHEALLKQFDAVRRTLPLQ